MSARTFCDRGLALAKAGGRYAHPRLILAVTILASTLDYIDGSVVNVGLPAVGRDLHGDAAQLQWVVNAFLLPLSALLLFGGALGDRFGRRRLLTAGLGVVSKQVVHASPRGKAADAGVGPLEVVVVDPRSDG